MKKSFKKAGAAVLSLSMLLAMGAVSMPVYADNDNPTNWPGQVKVVIDKDSAWADDTDVGREFEYLDNVESGAVTMYRVATLSGAGWQWEEPFKTALAGKTYTTTGNLDDFRKLLATTTDASNNEHFTATSEELLQLASALERVTRDNTGAVKAATDVARVDQQTLALDANGDLIAYLPEDSKLEQLANATTGTQAGTKDVIGYYLITTTTNDAGVVLQPVLISLKNSKANNGQVIGDNPVVVALKGYEINVEKKVSQVKDKDKLVSLGGDVISTSGNTAIVAKDDVITYTIETEIPKYDVNLPADGTGMKAFTITDDPDDGLVVLKTGSSGSGGSSTVVDGLNVSVKKANGDSATLAEGDSADYTVTTDPTTGGFTISIPASKYHTNSNSAGEKLEGLKLTVTFNATVDDEKFKTQNMANATVDDLTTAAQVTGQATAAGTVITDAGNWTTHSTAATVSTGSEDETNILTLTSASDIADVTPMQWAQLKIAKTGDYKDITAEEYAAAAAQATREKKAADDLAAAQAMVASDNAKIGELLEKTGTWTLTDTERVQGYLAVLELRKTEAGNKNVATINYGNEYATAQGDGNDTDDADVFSVDLDLTKITETLNLVDNVDKANRTNQNKEDWYNPDDVEEKVSGAVFELIKKDDNTGADGSKNKSLGLAVSDANGKLWLLNESATETEEKPTIATTIEGGAIAYYTTRHDATADKDYYTVYTVSDMEDASHNEIVTNHAWRKLTKGDYILKELYTPAGYKTVTALKDGITFTVGAEKADPNNAASEYTGTFTGETTASDKIVKGQAITYVGTDGSLQASIINPKDDVLPATGGIGTVLFTAGGISVVLIAGALFVMYMKKREAEEE